MSRQEIIKYGYIVTILLLLVAISAVHLNGSPGGNNALAKHLPEDSGNGSVFSVVDAIARLYFLLPIFIEPEKREGMSLDEKLAVEQEFLSLLNKIPEDTITDKMLSLELVTLKQLSSMNHKRPFINRLAGVAMNGIITPTKVEDPRFGSIYFKTNPSNSATQKFTSQSKAIYAFFDSSAYKDRTVFVKWYESVKGRMSLFKQFPINENDINHIWIYNEKGFPKGHYQVEIYRVDGNFELLSRGNYRVE